ncbi:MAG TPA: GNAT family N-acetyltransferase, partial [Azospirillum sp.]
MPTDPGYRPFAHDDADAVAYLARHGFGIPAEDVEGFRDLLGDAAFRVLVRDGRPVASAAVWPMDQWFGGRRVPSFAVNQVTTDPAVRGRGAATALMAGVLAEA